MSYENINLWFAKNNKDEIVTINEVDKKNKDVYRCPLCNSEVISRQGDITSWHFAHVDKSKCNSESMVHFWVKNKLLKVGDRFSIKTDEILQFEVKELYIEKQYIINEKIYKPDITVITTNDKVIYFEIANSNKKKVQEYLDVWIELGNIVVEVDSKDLINNNIKHRNSFNSLYYNGRCFNIKNNKDKEYHDLIGKYKENMIDSKEYQDKKNVIEKLDWLWKDINNYLKNELSISELSDEIQEIEDFKAQNIVVDIIKKKRCINIMNDYIDYNKNKILEYLQNSYGKFTYKLSNERFIYDRIYKGFIIDIFYNEENIYNGFISFDIKNTNYYYKNNYFRNKCYPHYLKLELESDNEFMNQLENYNLKLESYCGSYLLRLYNNETNNKVTTIPKSGNLNSVKTKIIKTIEKDKNKAFLESFKSNVIQLLKDKGFNVIENNSYIRFILEKNDYYNNIDFKINYDISEEENVQNFFQEYFDICKKTSELDNLIKIRKRISERFNLVKLKNRGDISFNVSMDLENRIVNIKRTNKSLQVISISEFIPYEYEGKDLFNYIIDNLSEKLRCALYDKKEEMF